MHRPIKVLWIKSVLVLALFRLGPIGLNAQVKTLSVPGQEWHEPTTWYPIGVPTANDSVIIGGYTFIKPDSTARALHVSISVEGHLFIDRDLNANKPGRLLINNAPGNAIENAGNLVNGGRITINTAGDSGIRSTGDFQIWDKARINIDSVHNYGLRIENSDMNNEGVINIERTRIAGIYATSSIITIGPSGSVSLTNCHSYGLHNSSFFENEGVINIDTIDGTHGHAIYNAGHLLNYDTIRVSHANGFLLGNYDSLTNHLGGVILLSESESSYGLYSDGYCANHGSISVDHTDDVGVYAHTEFYNYGNIICSDIQDDALYLEEGVFINDGFIQLDRSRSGLYVEDNSHFVNLDIFILDSIQLDYIWNRDSLSNSGYICLSNSTSSESIGIYNAVDDAVITNMGTMKLYNLDSIALLNLSDFINEDTLLIQRVYEKGLYNEDSIYNGVNGYIEISSINTGEPAVVNLGSILNENVLIVDNCEGGGIVNLGSVTNEDSIFLSGLNSFGFLNYKDLENHGYLDILNIRQGMVEQSIRSKEGREVWANAKYDQGIKRPRTKSSGLSDNVAIDNDGAFGTALLHNTGQIVIRDADVGLLNSGLITNADSIEIDEVRLGMHTCYPMAMTMDPLVVKVDNDGFISMNTEDGMIVGGGTIFNVGASGELIIRSSDDDMININLEAIFDCSGILDVGELIIEP